MPLAHPGFGVVNIRIIMQTIYAFFALWYYLSFPSEYQKLLLKQEPMYDCNIERYQSICEDMPAIIEIKDYKTILKILRDYIIGGK